MPSSITRPASRKKWAFVFILCVARNSKENKGSAEWPSTDRREDMSRTESPKILLAMHLSGRDPKEKVFNCSNESE